MKSPSSQLEKIKPEQSNEDKPQLFHDESTNSSLKECAVKGDSEAKTETESDCEWDDDDFEFAELSIDVDPLKDDRTILGVAMAVKVPPKKAEHKVLSTDDTKDDWLKPLRSSAEQTEDTGKGEEYWTSQFQRLCTPVSKKKSRCAVCTRPLTEEGTIYCKQHTPAKRTFKQQVEDKDDRKGEAIDRKQHKPARYSSKQQIEDKGDGKGEKIYRKQHKPVKYSSKQQVENKGDGKGEEYLTSQFERLCTPVSRKKSRCAVCTRPLTNEGTVYCNEHMPAEYR